MLETMETIEKSTEQTIQPASVNLAEIKSLAKQMLPTGSVLRSILLSLPDVLPREQALAKMEILVQLLYAEVHEK